MHTSVFLLIHHEWLLVKPLLFPLSTGEYRALSSLMFAVLPLWVLLQFCHKASNQTPVLFAFLPKLVQLLFWEAVCQGLVAVPSKHPVSGAAATPQIPGDLFGLCCSWLLQPYLCVCCKFLALSP